MNLVRERPSGNVFDLRECDFAVSDGRCLETIMLKDSLPPGVVLVESNALLLNAAVFFVVAAGAIWKAINP